MTPLQAGALFPLSRYAETKLTDAVTLLGLGHPRVAIHARLQHYVQRLVREPMEIVQ
jgi:hypothetical protein